MLEWVYSPLANRGLLLAARHMARNAPPNQPMSRSSRRGGAPSRRWGARATLWVGVAIALLWVVGPLYFAAMLSIKPQYLFFRGGFVPWLDFAPTLDHWRTEFTVFWFGPGMGPALVNSTLVGVASAILATTLGAMAAFSLVRRPPAQLALVMLLLLLPRLLPPVVIALPYTRLMQSAGLDDTRLALILAHTALLLPWALAILYAAMRAVPRDLLEAAELDGSSESGMLRAVVLPLCRGALLGSLTLCFALSWMEYPFGVLNMGDHITTVPAAVAFLFTKDGIEFEFVGSHLILALVPPMLLGLAANPVLVRALSLGRLDDRPQASLSPPVG